MTACISITTSLLDFDKFRDERTGDMLDRFDLVLQRIFRCYEEAFPMHSYFWIMTEAVGIPANHCFALFEEICGPTQPGQQWSRPTTVEQ